jgi:hypothetical protein
MRETRPGRPSPLLTVMALLAVGCKGAPSSSSSPEPIRAEPPTTAAPTASTVSSVARQPLVAPSASPATLVDLTSPAPYSAVDAGATQDPDSFDPWIQARIANARAGAAELVRVPIHQHVFGWGCTCPFYYVGDGENGGFWIEPSFEPTARGPDHGETLISEGYFTGTSHVEDGDGPVKYDVFDFRVVRDRGIVHTKSPDGGDEDWPLADDRCVVQARADQAHLETTAPADGRIFLVIEAAFPLSGGHHTFELARAHADKLRDRFPNVALVDTRTVPGLFCCNYAVVLDRFATQAAATAAAADAKKHGVAAAQVRRGW